MLTKIEKWWIIEFEIPVNPDFDEKKIIEDQVNAGTSIFLEYLMEIANDEIRLSAGYGGSFFCCFSWSFMVVDIVLTRKYFNPGIN